MSKITLPDAQKCIYCKENLVDLFAKYNNTVDLVNEIKQNVNYIIADTVIDLKGMTGMNDGDMAEIKGYNAIGDGGGGIFIWISGNQSSNVSSDPLNGIWIPPDSDPSGSAGAWKRVFFDKFGRLEWFGIKNDGTQDCSVAFNTIVNNGLNVKIGNGRWLFTNPAHLPDFTSWGNPWDELNPFVCVGEGLNQSIIIVDVPDGDYGFKHPSVNQTSPRGQNGIGVRICDITFEGVGGFGKTIHAIGISNARMPIIERCAFRGFPLGKGIHFWAHSKGGIFSPVVRDCYFGQSKHSTDGTYKWYEVEDLAKTIVHTGIHFDGPTDTVGKVTDPVVISNRFDNCLISISGVGHGTYLNGGCANTQIFVNTCGNEGLRKVEEGNIEAVNNTTQITLRTTAGTYPTYTNGYPVGWAIWIKDPNTGRWDARQITAYDSINRTVTFDSAFSFTLSVGDEYRISYTTPESIQLAGITQLPCVAIIDEGDYHHRFIGNRSEENNAGIVIYSRGKIKYPRILLFGNSFRIQSGREHYWNDGTTFYPTYESDLTPIGGRGIVGPNISPTNMADMKYSQVVHWCVNKTGSKLYPGDIVSYMSNDTSAVTTISSGNVSCIIADVGIQEFQPDDLVPIAAIGSRTKIRLDASLIPSVSPNDLIYVKADSTLGVTTTWSSERIIAQITHSASATSGTYTAYCIVK